MSILVLLLAIVLVGATFVTSSKAEAESFQMGSDDI